MTRPLRLVAVSGGLQRPSKSAALAEHLSDLIADEVPCEQRLVELGQLAPQLAGAVWRSQLPGTVERELAAVEQADVLVVATPVFRGAYTGLFKHFFDRQGFRGLPPARRGIDTAGGTGGATGIAAGRTDAPRQALPGRGNGCRLKQTTFFIPRSGHWITMNAELHFSLKSICFDENYQPSDSTRITTNFANLARGASRQQNLRHTLKMIDNRFNELAHWDNPEGDRYHVELEIITVEMRIGASGSADAFPLIEILKPGILDRKSNQRIDGIAGNNFSSYVRDYDFSVLLPEYNLHRAEFGTPDNFGDLHGKLFKQFAHSSTYREHFAKPPVICISASTSKTYRRTGNQHPVLGLEYQQNELSSTDRYFGKMGMQVRFFMPPNGVAPLAFYFHGDLLADYTNLELIGTISTMETFQKIYRPEIYNANSAAASVYQPSLKHQDYSLTQIVYDREERSQLAVKQGKFAQEHFIKPYQNVLEQWAAEVAI
jgi:hypothetical protein